MLRLKDIFYATAFQLQELSLHLFISYKEKIMWKETQEKPQDQLEFIKQIQNHRKEESHNISKQSE